MQFSSLGTASGIYTPEEKLEEAEVSTIWFFSASLISMVRSLLPILVILAVNISMVSFFAALQSQSLCYCDVTGARPVQSRGCPLLRKNVLYGRPMGRGGGGGALGPPP